MAGIEAMNCGECDGSGEWRDGADDYPLSHADLEALSGDRGGHGQRRIRWQQQQQQHRRLPSLSPIWSSVAETATTAALAATSLPFLSLRSKRRRRLSSFLFLLSLLSSFSLYYPDVMLSRVFLLRSRRRYQPPVTVAERQRNGGEKRGKGRKGQN